MVRSNVSRNGILLGTVRDQPEGRALRRTSDPVDSSGNELRRQTKALGSVGGDSSLQHHPYRWIRRQHRVARN